jgi:hypothetical protein
VELKLLHKAKVTVKGAIPFWSDSKKILQVIQGWKSFRTTVPRMWNAETKWTWNRTTQKEGVQRARCSACIEGVWFSAVFFLGNDGVMSSNTAKFVLFWSSVRFSPPPVFCHPYSTPGPNLAFLSYARSYANISLVTAVRRFVRTTQ